MYLAIDIGGTKVLLVAFDAEGRIVKEYKFPTAKNYGTFLEDLASGLEQFKTYHFEACCCAIPGKVDRNRGIGVRFGNLAWTNVSLVEDLKKLTGLTKVYLENDAKLAGLFESKVNSNYQNILYVTVGTGMGIAVINGGNINFDVEDLGGAIFMIEEDGQQRPWDEVSSGHALTAKYGKMAREIEDPKIWQEYVVSLARGLSQLVNKYHPEVIIIGGGVGAHFHKYGKLLNEELKKYGNNMVEIPPVIQADKPENAVIYGCFDFIHQKLGNRL